MKNNSHLLVVMPQDMRKKLEKFCLLTDRDMSSSIRRALKQLFEKEMPEENADDKR